MSAKTSRTENSIVGDADPKTIKRSQWEAFEFELEAPGIVRVINRSHENPEEHSYRVNVETDTPVACECKAFEYSDGPCKHMVAVAIREPVLKAAQSELVADGGPTWRPARTVRKAAVALIATNCPALSASRRTNDDGRHRPRGWLDSHLGRRLPD